MASMLDERPVRKSSPLFGRALIAQQQAEAKAQEDAQKDARDAARDRETAQHHRQTEDLDRIKVQNDMLSKQAALSAQIHKEEVRGEQLIAFTRAQEAIGNLEPTDPMLSAKIAKIQAENNVLFEGEGTSFGQVLGAQVKDLFARRTAVQAAINTNNRIIGEKYPGATVVTDKQGVPDVAATAKAYAEQQHAALTTSGLVPKSGKDPTTGIEMGQPAKDTSQLTAHDKADLAWKSYSEATRLRSKFKDDPKTGKPPAESQDVVTALDAQRSAAIQTLSGLGISVDSKSPIANEHPIPATEKTIPPYSNYDPNASATPTADAPVATSGEIEDQPSLMNITPDLYLAAHSAIASGRDPEGVKQKLISQGYDPSGLTDPAPAQ